MPEAVDHIDPIEIYDLLARLSDRSLVTPENDGSEARYRLLETVRQYARDLLVEDNQSEVLFRRHLDYCAELAERSEPKLKGPEQFATLALLETEWENIRAALERGTSGEGSEKALQLAADLVIFWWRQGHLAEGMEWCLRAAGTGLGQRRSVLRARLLSGAGFLLSLQGDCSTARAYYEESYEILTEIGDRMHLVETLCGLGFTSFFLDEYEVSRAYMAQADSASKEVDDTWYNAWCRYFLGILARVQGDFEGAIRSYHEGLAIYRKLGDRMSASYPIYDIGLAEYYRGNFEVARPYLSESLAIRRESNDSWGVSESLFGLGLVAAALEEFSEARARFTESSAVAQEVGDKTRTAICAHWLGQIALIEGDLETALSRQQESLEIYQALEDRWGLAHCLAGYASLAAHRGDWNTAVSLWSTSEKLRDDIGSPLPPSERAQRARQLDLARDAMGDERYEEAWEEGRRLEVQAAIELGTQNA